jgi:hypothetical protein
VKSNEWRQAATDKPMIEYDKATDQNVVGFGPARVKAGEYGLVIAVVKPDGTMMRVDAALGPSLMDVKGEDFHKRVIHPALYAIAMKSAS